jgi:hypothetical protein
MPVLWSPEMKDQRQALARDVEKRLKLLDEYERIRHEKTGETDGTEEEIGSEDSPDVSPSTQFFLTE